MVGLQAFAISVLGLSIFRGGDVVPNYFKLKQGEAVLSDTVEQLKSDNESITSEMEKLRKSRSYAKKVLRDKYHLTEEGESIHFFAN